MANVKVTDNLDLLMVKGSTSTKLKVPVVPLAIGIPLRFDARVDEEIDAIDEEQILDEVQGQIDAVMSKLAQEVTLALTQALMSGVWSWEGGSRDIYNTGRLARSVNVSVDNSGISVAYSAPYANIVHNGGYIFPYGNRSARPVYLPARPWVTSVLYGGGPVPQFDFDDFLSRNIE